MFKDKEEAADVVQKLLPPKKRNLQFTLPSVSKSPTTDSRRFSLDPITTSSDNHLEVPT